MNLLILGSSGTIGSQLFEKFINKSSINLYTLSRSNNNSNNNNHTIFDFFNNNLDELNFNIKFDVIINCLGVDIFKKDKLIYSVYNKFLNLLKSDKYSIWIEISSISVMGFNEPLHNNLSFTNYAINKLKAENSLIKMSKNFNKKCKIFRFGAVVSNKFIEKFVQDKFQKFIKFNIFFNFFFHSAFIRITTSEEVCRLIDTTIFSGKNESNIEVHYKNLDVYEILKNKFIELKIFNIQNKLIYFSLYYLNKKLYYKFLSIFHANLNFKKKEISYKLEI